MILSDALTTLADAACKSVLVEVNDDFKEQAKQVDEIMTKCNFVLEVKQHAEMIEKSRKFGRTYNQIWVR